MDVKSLKPIMICNVPLGFIVMILLASNILSYTFTYKELLGVAGGRVRPVLYHRASETASLEPVAVFERGHRQSCEEARAVFHKDAMVSENYYCFKYLFGFPATY